MIIYQALHGNNKLISFHHPLCFFARRVFAAGECSPRYRTGG